MQKMVHDVSLSFLSFAKMVTILSLLSCGVLICSFTRDEKKKKAHWSPLKGWQTAQLSFNSCLSNGQIPQVEAVHYSPKALFRVMMPCFLTLLYSVIPLWLSPVIFNSVGRRAISRMLLARAEQSVREEEGRRQMEPGGAASNLSEG